MCVGTMNTLISILSGDEGRKIHPAGIITQADVILI